MSRLRGRSQNRESQETCPEGTGAASQRKHFGAAKARPRLVGLLLALITLVAYIPVARDSFLGLDDGDYVTGNRIVQNGLTWAGVKWAFTTSHAGNWHPLTWLSHMLDCELFGLNAGAQHYINVLFHVANVVLLFALLRRLTGALWPSVFVAALFAWHPLHVESVAWIAERKDVLSTFFELLALLAYTRYAQCVTSDKWQAARTEKVVPAPALSRITYHVSLFYGLALIFFALGLMAKPMLVTLPFVLLLLDYWPLQRFSLSASGSPLFLRLALEKWPFFVLTVALCVVTFLAQHNGGMVTPLQQFPLDLRLGNVPLSYALYLEKAVWPIKLSINYPLQNQLSWPEVAAAAVFLVVITWLVWRAHRRCPYLLVGWLWFLGTLVPVIGLVQVGDEVLADRYTYVPLIGIFIAVTFGIKDLITSFQIGVVPTVAAGGLVLVSCLVLTERQLSCWRNDETLFSHAIAVTKNNAAAHNNLATALQKQGRLAEALANYQEAIHINPYWALAHNNLGTVLAELGRFDEAMNQYKQAIQLDTGDPRPYFLMGEALLKQGHDAEAIDYFREALRLGPNNFYVLAYAARVLATEDNPEVRDGKTALMLATRAYLLTGGAQPSVLDALSMACAETGHFKNAQQIEQRAIRLAQAAGLETNDMNLRLELYKSGRPYRETFTNAP